VIVVSWAGKAVPASASNNGVGVGVGVKVGVTVGVWVAVGVKVAVRVGVALGSGVNEAVASWLVGVTVDAGPQAAASTISPAANSTARAE